MPSASTAQSNKPASYEVAPYGGVGELLTHTTTRFALIREDNTVIEDLSAEEANIFAAAPDLLAVVKRLTDVHGQMTSGTPEHRDGLIEAYDAAIAAINKAEGRES